jgi:membrane peptidoglycan carboxypeptidase
VTEASPDQPAPSAPPRRRRLWAWVLGGAVLLVAILAWVAVKEARDSRLQARYLAPVAAELSWEVAPGAADRLLEPANGPYDLRLGYAGLADRVERARAQGFQVVAQARSSARLHEIVEEHGLFPVYHEKERGGLDIVDRDGELLFRHRTPEVGWERFEDIPPIVWQTLLFIENRTALAPDAPARNPAVEWGRLVRSSMDLAFRYLGREGNVAGASTLATQIEKYRHASEGRTATPRDKLVQMGSASLRAYLDGPETLEARRRIVREYVNTVPLAAIRGEGEIAGIPDGLHAWFGTDLDEATRALASLPADRTGEVPGPLEVGGMPGAAAEPTDPEELAEAARVYRQVLSLFLAQRRPTWYLANPEGTQALARLTERYLGVLEAEGIIGTRLAAAAREARTDPRVQPPERPPVDFVERKAVNTVRTGLLNVLGVPRLYDLDRLDLEARTTIDAGAQSATTRLFRDLRDPAFIAAQGFNQFRLLDRGDPAGVVYSVSIHERTAMGNVVRIQADNLDAPFNLNESARLELGSTAKLRTLASYLEIIAELHERFGELAPDSLRRFPVAGSDRLSTWARDRILAQPGVSREELLRQAMDRMYSGSPAERFATGGGVQTFSNFDNTWDRQSMTVWTGFRHSVNLVFVRMMRDVVSHYMYRVPGSTAHVLEERGTPLRQEYLARFADREGIQFLNQFIPKYRGKTRFEILDGLFDERRLSPQRMAWAYVTAAPDPTPDEFERVLRENLPLDAFSDAVVADLYRRADPAPHGLADLGYLASIHPLELWVARFFIENPEANGADAIRASEEARQEVYRWLFQTRRTGAQDQRIRSLLEVEAFTQVLRGWQRLGYPFGNIVPSLGTSIGSSGDRPAALNELVGIILNEGVRLPTYRVSELRLAGDTPWDTRMVRGDAVGEPVMDPAVARVLREAMVDVVALGTARRVSGVFAAPDGTPLEVGGKTGTGDNRYRVFAPGGRLLESRSVNRTSTFVFFIGDRYYGVISAYVPGEAADRYHFTSALPTQMLRELAPVIRELLEAEAREPDARPVGEPAAVPDSAPNGEVSQPGPRAP